MIMTSFMDIICTFIKWFTNLQYHCTQLKNGDPVENSQHCDSQCFFDKHADGIGQKLNQCMLEVSKITKRLQVLEDLFNELASEVAAKEKTLYLKQAMMEEEFTQISSSSMDKLWILVIVMAVIGELLLAYVIAKMWFKVRDHEGTGHYVKGLLPIGQENGAKREDEIRGRMDILRKVRTRQLDGKVCVVSFHQETAGNHRDLLMSALNDNEAVRNAEHVAWQINKHDDILRAPSAKLYLVFVDFNEQNVILEDPTKGLGDLRLTTVQAIGNMGGDVIVIYVRDVGSKNLPKGHLYNHDLNSVMSNPDLNLLNFRQRMLSIYDGFTDFQKSHIQEIVIENNLC